jgi:hypothetical protein
MSRHGEELLRLSGISPSFHSMRLNVAHELDCKALLIMSSRCYVS